jgi:hypothetical protein
MRNNMRREYITHWENMNDSGRKILKEEVYWEDLDMDAEVK